MYKNVSDLKLTHKALLLMAYFHNFIKYLQAPPQARCRACGGVCRGVCENLSTNILISDSSTTSGVVLDNLLFLSNVKQPAHNVK